jgi:hypothetical protein
MRYCPYLGKDIEESQTSPEHFIPESLGAPKELTVVVDSLTNSQMGTRVDAPFVDSYIIRFFRVHYKVLGKDGRLPELPLRRVVQIEGHDINVDARVSPEGLELRPEPRVLENFEGYDKFVIVGEQDADRINAQIDRSAARKGMSVKRTLVKKVAAEFPMPKIESSEINRDIVIRFMAKACLGTASYFFGNDFTRGDLCSGLREIVFSEGPLGECHQPLAIFSAGDTQENHVNSFDPRAKNRHTIGWFLRGNATWVAVNIFNYFGCETKVSSLVLPGIPSVVEIDYSNKQMERNPYSQSDLCWAVHPEPRKYTE